MILKRPAVALLAGLYACLSPAVVLAADYGSGYRYAPSGQGAYASPSAGWSHGYVPNYDAGGYPPQDYGAGSRGGPPYAGGVSGYQFRERPEDKRVERDSSPRYRPDPDLTRRSRGSWSPTGEMWSAPGAQGPAVIFRPWESGSQKPTDQGERSSEYPAWPDPGLGMPPWPGGGPGYFPPPY
jgi:hypothetical protein